MIALRDATPEDAPALTAIFLAARAAAMPWLPQLHSEASTLAWMAASVLLTHRVVVAEIAGEPAGFAALSDDRLDHLYVTPSLQGAGVGRRLLAAAKAASPQGLRLIVFQRNLRARSLYERVGFRVVALRNGEDNEEREPDALYSWRPQTPAHKS